MAIKELEENAIKKGVKWLFSKIKKAVSNKKEDDDKGDIKTGKDVQKKMRMFNMYTLVYTDPKYKKELNFYDAMPLIFPIDIKQGLEGPLLRALNIHYLSPANRVKFIKELEAIVRKAAERHKYDPDNLEDYPHQNITKAVGRYMDKVYRSGGGSAGSHIRQAFRSYFFGRIKSKIKKIPIDEWENASKVVLPVFRKQTASQVYKEIAKEYQKYKGNYRSSIY